MPPQIWDCLSRIFGYYLLTALFGVSWFSLLEKTILFIYLSSLFFPSFSMWQYICKVIFLPSFWTWEVLFLYPGCLIWTLISSWLSTRFIPFTFSPLTLSATWTACFFCYWIQRQNISPQQQNRWWSYNPAWCNNTEDRNMSIVCHESLWKL